MNVQETSSRILDQSMYQNYENTGQVAPVDNEHLINFSIWSRTISSICNQYWFDIMSGSFYAFSLCPNISGELYNMITKLKNLDKNSNSDNAIDIAFDWIEDKFEINDLSAVDTFISFILTEDFSFYFLVSILTTTLRYKGELKNRSVLLEKASEVGSKLTTDNELLKETLLGL